jgi:hypothetical protein
MRKGRSRDKAASSAPDRRSVPPPGDVPACVTVHVPMIFTVRGGRKTIIGPIPEQAHTPPRTRFDDSITKAIARAWRWQTLIEAGEYANITDLAKAEKVNPSYAGRMLRLTLLAPDIVETILDRRGTHLTLDVLMKPWPVKWDEQRAALRLKR